MKATDAKKVVQKIIYEFTMGNALFRIASQSLSKIDRFRTVHKTVISRRKTEPDPPALGPDEETLRRPTSTW